MVGSEEDSNFSLQLDAHYAPFSLRRQVQLLIFQPVQEYVFDHDQPAHYLLS